MALVICAVRAEEVCVGLQVRSFVIDKSDEFSYTDPVDSSVSANQGIRFLFSDGSRVIFRLSGVSPVLPIYRTLHRASMYPLLHGTKKMMSQ